MRPLLRIGVERCSLLRCHIAVSQAPEFGTDQVRRYRFKYKEYLENSIMLIVPPFNGVHRTGNILPPMA